MTSFIFFYDLFYPKGKLVLVVDHAFMPCYVSTHIVNRLKYKREGFSLRRLMPPDCLSATILIQSTVSNPTSSSLFSDERVNYRAKGLLTRDQLLISRLPRELHGRDLFGRLLETIRINISVSLR